MNMTVERLLCVVVLLSAGCAAAETSSLPMREWKVALKVCDELGEPVTNAQAWVAYAVPREEQSVDPFQSSGWAVAGRTDTNGLFVASHPDTGSVSLGIHVRKSGYYPTDFVHELGLTRDLAKWNLASSVVLKKIRNPIPMYAKLVNSPPPVFDEPIGYDLTAGDWVAPHGKGAKADVLFAKTYSLKSAADYDSKLTVSFPNPGDGIQQFDVPYRPNEGSGLRSPHESPEAGYQNKLIRETSAHPGQPSKFDYDARRNYFIRVRSVLDKEGNVKSALYGKIYGDFMQFRYYLNPTPNDRNVEFDPKQNLLKSLTPLEQVTQP